MSIELTDEEAKLVLKLAEIALQSQGVLPVLELMKKLTAQQTKSVKPVAAVRKKRGM